MLHSRIVKLSSTLWWSRIKIRGLWSIITSKCCIPMRHTLHFHILHITTSSSSSITAYLDSASVRQWDTTWTRYHYPSTVCCCVTNPIPCPCLLASVHVLVAFITLQKTDTSVIIRHFFTFFSAWSSSVVHINSFLVLRSCLNGVISPAIVLNFCVRCQLVD